MSLCSPRPPISHLMGYQAQAVLRLQKRSTAENLIVPADLNIRPVTPQAKTMGIWVAVTNGTVRVRVRYTDTQKQEKLGHI